MFRDRKVLERHLRRTNLLRWHGCRVNFARKIFFWATNFLTKNAPKFPPTFLSLYSVGQKRSRKIPAKIPTKFPKFPCEKSKKKSQTSFCRSAGRKNCPENIFSSELIYTEQMDAAVLGGQTAGGDSKTFPRLKPPLLQCQHWESAKVLAGLVFCEMLSQYSQSAFQGSPRVAGGGVSSSLRPKLSASICSV